MEALIGECLRCERHGHLAGDRFSVFKAIGDHAQRQGFHRRQRLFPGPSVNHDSRKRGDIGDPPSVRFPIEFYFEVESCGALAARFMRIVYRRLGTSTLEL